MSEWEYKSMSIVMTISGYRPGWRGVWDHLIEMVWHGRQRVFQRDHNVTFAFWAKNAGRVEITGTQMVL